jgi:hypothetical protein
MNSCDTDPKSERWLPVPVAEYQHLYQVSDLGRIRRLVNKRVRRLTCGKDGYEYCTLRAGGRCRNLLVQRLVVVAFIRPFLPGEVTAHRDGDRENNRADNLEIVTPRESMHHAIRTGWRDNKGEKHYKAVLTEVQVREIRRLHAGGSRVGGMSYAALAKRFGVSTGAVEAVTQRRSWRHVQDKQENDQ